MDKKTYEALNSTAYPKIKYTLTSDDLIPGNMLNTTDKPQRANITTQLQIQVKFNISAPEKEMFTGEIRVNMTEFNVDPPTELLGTTKTG